MAINIFNKTIILITLYEPNISIAQKRVKLLIPCNSNAIKSTKPNDAQNSDCDVSNKLGEKKIENFHKSFVKVEKNNFSLCRPYFAKRLQIPQAFSLLSKSGMSACK